MATIKLINGRVKQFYPSNKSNVKQEKNSNPEKFNILLNLERLIRFTTSILPDSRTELERMPLEQLFIAFKEAEMIAEKRKEAK